jgi:transposase, IS5 family
VSLRSPSENGHRSGFKAAGINADARHKLIRDYTVSDASEHDSQKFDELLSRGNKLRDVYADSAYHSAKTERKLRAQGFRSRIHNRGRRNRPLTEVQARANHRKSKVRLTCPWVFEPSIS